MNRGDFEMARVIVDPATGLHSATVFDWTKGPPYEVETIIEAATLAEARKAVKDYLEPIAEPRGSSQTRSIRQEAPGA